VLKDSDLADPMRSASSRSTGRARSKRTRPARTASTRVPGSVSFSVCSDLWGWDLAWREGR
jgi:hypothetical protein